MRNRDTLTRYVIGTREYYEDASNRWRVVCATCGRGPETRYPTREAASKAACNQSSLRCNKCGAS